jgi:hypothetical protein
MLSIGIRKANLANNGQTNFQEKKAQQDSLVNVA